MKDLQIIRIEDGKQEVSALELYKFLEPKAHYRNWIKRMLKYGFIEGADFRPKMGESKGGRPTKDYILSLDCAKSIAMVQRTERGKQIRQYFLECERIAKEKESKKIAYLKDKLSTYTRMQQIRDIRRMLNAEMRLLKEKVKEYARIEAGTQLTLNF